MHTHLSRALVALLLVAPAVGRTQPHPAPAAGDKDKDTDKNKDPGKDKPPTVTDDKGDNGDDDDDDDVDDDDKPDDKSPASEQHKHPAEDDNDGGVDDDQEGPNQVSEDDDEHRHHGHIHHEPGLGIEMITPNARVRLGFAVQPVVRYGHDTALANDTMDAQIRRARVNFDAELTHGAGLRVALQVKNGKLGIADLYGRWALDEHIEVQAGFLGAPGGLERDTNPFDLPFLERSALASFTHDREIGIKLLGNREGQFWRLSVGRDAPLGIGGDDPDIAPRYPPGVDPTQVNRDATKWNQSARVGVAPSEEFEASLGWNLRFRPDQPDYGDPAYEPNGTVFLDGRPYRGTSLKIGADSAISERHFRVLLEAAYRRDGEQLAFDGASGAETTLPGHLWWAGGYVTVGVTPDGRYGRAVDGAPLQYGWELMARFETAKVKPVDDFGATYFNTQLGWAWVPTPNIRIQADASLQIFGDFDQTVMMDNAGAKRFYGELWATWRL